MGPRSEAAACSPLSPFVSAFDRQIIPLSTEIAAHAEIGWPAPSPPPSGSSLVGKVTWDFHTPHRLCHYRVDAFQVIMITTIITTFCRVNTSCFFVGFIFFLTHLDLAISAAILFPLRYLFISHSSNLPPTLSHHPHHPLPSGKP